MYVWTTEVVPDVALGLNSVVILFTVFLNSVVEFGLINGLGPDGFFSLLGFESMIGLFFVIFFVGETKHLSENAKKEQYWPGAIYGRKLKPGELCEATPEVWSKATKQVQATSSTPDNADSQLYGIGATLSGSTLTRENSENPPFHGENPDN